MLAGKGSDQGELLSTRIICLPGNPKIHRERRKPQADYKHHTEAKKSALQHLSLPPTSWEPNVTTYIQCHTHARCWWRPEVRKTQFPPPLWQKSSLDQQVRCWYHRCPQCYRADLLQLHIGLPHYYCCCGWFSHFSHSAQKRLLQKRSTKRLSTKGRQYANRNMVCRPTMTRHPCFTPHYLLQHRDTIVWDSTDREVK